jgi:SAM-dependent methyltransferase
MDEHDSADHHDHAHGHASDQGFKAMLRYLRSAPRMWRSDINDATIKLVAPVSGERALDIGAGMGAGTILAARAGAWVVAVEPTAFMRRILSVRRLFQRARNQISVVDGTAEQLPVADHSTDAVWAVNTMHHWVDAERGAVEISRVLRPGGRAVLIDEDFEDPAHPDHDRFAHQNDGDDHHGFTMVDAEQMGTLLTTAGLVDVEATKRELADRPVIAVIGRADG